MGNLAKGSPLIKKLIFFVSYLTRAEKSYPDIHSLLLLSSLFNVSLDQLIKGDVETMKEIINEQEVKKFNYYGNIFSIHFFILIITAAPLFFWLERYAFIPFGVLFANTMFWAL